MNIKSTIFLAISLFSLTACYKAQEPNKLDLIHFESYYELSKIRAFLIHKTLDSLLYLEKSTTIAEIATLQDNEGHYFYLLKQVSAFNNYFSEISEFCDNTDFHISKSTTVAELLDLQDTLSSKCNNALNLVKELNLKRKQNILNNL